VRLNSLSSLAITKLDVLGGQEFLKICTGYEYDGKILNDFPANLNVLSACKPICETLPGWSEDISNIRKFEDLPQNACLKMQEIISIELKSLPKPGYK
jgi:adenylosuccinate synthase